MNALNTQDSTGILLKAVEQQKKNRTATIPEMLHF